MFARPMRKSEQFFHFSNSKEQCLVKTRWSPQEGVSSRQQATRFGAFRLINDLWITSVWVVIVNFDTSEGVERTAYMFKNGAVMLYQLTITHE